MPDFGFAIIATDRSFIPRADLVEEIENQFKSLQLIDQRLPKEHPESQVVKWSVGPGASEYLRGSPKAISVYVGEPTPFFDGTEVVSTTTFILETADADPTDLQPVLAGLLRTSLAIHPFRV